MKRADEPLALRVCFGEPCDVSVIQPQANVSSLA
jgi:hypothetical protein